MKKIECFVSPNAKPLDIAYNDMGGRYPCRAVLVVGEGDTPPRVWTEEEVHDILISLRGMFREFRGHDGTAEGFATIDMMFVDEFNAILKLFNIELPTATL